MLSFVKFSKFKEDLLIFCCCNMVSISYRYVCSCVIYYWLSFETLSLCRMMMPWLFWWSILHWYLFQILFELSQRGSSQLLRNLMWRDQLVKQFMCFRENMQLSTLPSWMYVYLLLQILNLMCMCRCTFIYLLHSTIFVSWEEEVTHETWNINSL